VRSYIQGVDERQDCEQPPELFEGVELVDGPAHLRKATMALADRPPTEAERQQVREDRSNIDEIIDQVLEEEAFLERLRKFFDLKLTRKAHCQNAAKKLGRIYKDREQACWWDTDGSQNGWSCKAGRFDPPEWNRRENETTEALCKESVHTIAFIVDRDLSFKKVLNADWTIVNPYSAKSYGIFEEVYDEENLEDPPDPENFKRAQVPRPKNVQARIPHSGVMTNFMHMAAVGTNRSNRHRRRVWWYYQKFLGTDLLQLAPEDGINALAANKTEKPLVDNKDCAVCHHVMDPAAGMFVRWGRKHGDYKPRRSWEKNYWRRGDTWGNGRWTGAQTWGRGFGMERLKGSPEAQEHGYDKALERGVRWIGKRATEDPRFAAQSVRYAYELVTGEEPHELPTDLEADDYDHRLDRYLAERHMLDRVTERFRDAGYDFKVAVREIVKSEFFRAVRTAESTDRSRSSLEGIGTSELLTPQQLHRRIINLLGVSWEYNRGPLLLGKFRVPFGGVSGNGTRVPMENPNAVWTGAFKRLTHELGCMAPARDFARAVEERLLFPHVEPSTTPANGEEAIRKNIRYLHRRLLGERLDPGDEAGNATYQLFRDIQEAGRQNIGDGKNRSLMSQCQHDDVTEDPNYTIRAWQAVLTYLMSDYAFWYD
jgi:hypothetical protein